jgi:dsDNA-binding SOS-regulon protein
MTMKAPKPVPNRAPAPAVEADERHQGDVDAFIARNRDALNASIKRSRIEVGKVVRSNRTIDEIVAHGRKRHSIGSK